MDELNVIEVQVLNIGIAKGNTARQLCTCEDSESADTHTTKICVICGDSSGQAFELTRI